MRNRIVGIIALLIGGASLLFQALEASQSGLILLLTACYFTGVGLYQLATGERQLSFAERIERIRARKG